MLGLKARDLAVWVGYCAMLAAIVPWHEPWRDEAQAWLLARDLSIPQLLLHNLRYEGHPALWYLILWVPAHLHVGYVALGWIAAAIAAAGIYVLLRLAPFPFYLRAVLPFTFFLAYQFAVVARSYVLFPLLCFLIAHVYRRPRPRPVLMAVLLGLLANVSVHGTLVACGMALAYGWRLWRVRRAGAGEGRPVMWAAAIFAASVALVVATIYPPKDIYVDVAPTVSHAIHSIAVQQNGVAGLRSSSTAGGADVTAGAGVAVGDAGAAQPASKAGHLRARLADLPRVLCYSVATSRLLCVVLYALVVAFLVARRQILLLAPLVVLALFLGFIYAREWHLGLVWVVLLMIVWAAWDADTMPGTTLQRVLAVVLAMVSVLQLPWTWRAMRFDRREQYYPSRQAAAYLHTLPAGLRIAGFWDTTTVLPYFDHNIFFNQPRASFNWYSTHNTLNADAAATLATRPDVVVVWSQNPGIVTMAEAEGYRETHRFCGTPYLPNMVNEESCYVVLEWSGGK
jgi:hypothetical protein